MHKAAIRKKVLFLILAAGMLPLWARGEIIRLKNGIELQCEILECSEEKGLTIRRLDNGGVLDLRWDHILDEDVKAIRYARGYTDEEAQVVMIRAKRIFLRNGTFEDGLLMESDQSDKILLRRRGKVYPISKSLVKDMENVELEAKEVYTLDELYLQRLDEGAPETTQDHFTVGVFCESITYYAMALDHYEAVREMDADFKSDVIDRKIKIMSAKIKEADATAVLDEAKHLAYRNQFYLALQRIQDFEEEFPDSIQMGYKEELKSEVLIKRHAYYGQKILTDYFSIMDKVAYKVAANRDLNLKMAASEEEDPKMVADQEISLEVALEFATEDMGPTIRKRLADMYKIPLEEVEDLWLNRRGGAPRTGSYGTGTFILGPDKAKEVVEEEKGGSKKKDEEEEEAPKTLDERLKKKIDELRKQKEKYKGKRRSRVRMEEIGRTPEQWWATEGVNNRKHFLICYYAEMSGEMKILRARLNPCRSCHGKGWHEQIGVEAEDDTKLPCEVCKTLGIERTLRFK